MIIVENLVKNYGKVQAVTNLNLVADSGKITILLGDNGAGKSTTIKSIMNLLKYEGSITICGFENHTLEAKQLVGYIPETPILYDMLTVQEHIDFIGNAYKKANYNEIAHRYVELFELKDKVKTPAKELSKGMRQKLSIILALLTEPKALLVDEPLMGLDPQSIENILQLFMQLKESGTSILISTHIIDVVNEVWDAAYIMNKGKIVRNINRNDLDDQNLKEIFFQTSGVKQNDDVD